MMKKRTSSITFINILLVVTSMLISIDTPSVRMVDGNLEVPVSINASGLILTPSNNTLSMVKADIYYDIEYILNESDYDSVDAHYISYDLIGSYLVYNHNETLFSTALIPLTGFHRYNSFNLEVKANGTNLDYQIEYMREHELSDVFEQFFSYWSTDWLPLGYAAVFNVTFESNSICNVTYSYNYCYHRGPHFYETASGEYMLRGVKIYYYVGSAQTWNNNIDETIVMSLKGEVNPNYYVTPCRVYKKDGIGYYNWSWYNEPITEEVVGMSFSYIETHRTNLGINWIIIPLILAASILAFRRKRSV